MPILVGLFRLEGLGRTLLGTIITDFCSYFNDNRGGPGITPKSISKTETAAAKAEAHKRVTGDTVGNPTRIPLVPRLTPY